MCGTVLYGIVKVFVSHVYRADMPSHGILKGHHNIMNFYRTRTVTAPTVTQNSVPVFILACCTA